MTRRSRLALVLAAAVYLVAWTLGSTPLYPIAVGLGLAVPAAWLWTRGAAGPMRLSRKVSRAAHVEGEDVWVALTLERRSWVPTGPLTVRERIDGLGERQTRVRREGRVHRGEYVLEQLPRGRYEIEEADVVVEDPFGLERVTTPLHVPGALIVYPRLVDVEALFSEAGAHAQDGRRLLLRRPSGFDLHSVREYEQGESLRKVHWRSTARRGQLMVKELEDAPRDEIVVVLDCAPETVVGMPPDSSFDAAVRAAGSILRSHARRGRRAVLALNRLVPEVHTVSSLGGDWRAALDSLAAARPDGQRPVAELIGREGGVAARALELAVVTSRLDAQLAHRLAQRALSQRGVSVVWVDPGSFAGRPSERDPNLLRVAAAGAAVAVLRHGDDLRRVLEWRSPARAASGA